jgi:hypothetical protein
VPRAVGLTAKSASGNGVLAAIDAFRVRLSSNRPLVLAGPVKSKRQGAAEETSTSQPEAEEHTSRTFKRLSLDIKIWPAEACVGVPCHAPACEEIKAQ